MPFGILFAHFSVLFRYFLGIDFRIDFLMSFFRFVAGNAFKMDLIWHPGGHQKGARNDSRHASAPGPQFFMIFGGFGHPFWHYSGTSFRKSNETTMPEWFQKRMCQASGQIRKRLGTKRKKERKGKEKQVRKSGSERGGKGSKEREGRERRERRKAIQPCRELDGAEGAVERGTKRKSNKSKEEKEGNETNKEQEGREGTAGKLH